MPSLDEQLKGPDEDDTGVDAEFMHELSVDPTNAARVLSQVVSISPRTTDVKLDLVNKLRSITQFCDKYFEDRCDSVLLNEEIVNVVMEIILDEHNYQFSSHGSQTDWLSEQAVDLHAVDVLFSAVDIYELHLGAIDVTKPINRDRVLRQARAFWKIMWRKRSSLFKLYSFFAVTQPFDPLEPLPCSVAQCLLLLEDVLGATGEGANATTVEWDAISAQLSCWVHCTSAGAEEDADQLIELVALSLPGGFAIGAGSNDLTNWVDRILVDEQDRIGYAHAYQTSILARRAHGDLQQNLLTTFMVLSARKTFRDAIDNIWSTSTGPLFWLAKAAQRQACIYAESKREEEVLALVIDCMTNWCTTHDLPIFEVLDKYGTPLIAFLGYLTMTDLYENMRKTICSTIAKNAGRLKVARRLAAQANAPGYIVKDSLRRQWIISLQMLRARAHITGDINDVVKAWLRLGDAYGLDERIEQAWLDRGNNAKPSQPRGAPEGRYCGWSGCLCYEQKALYRLAACKGCWRVYYCGKTCQENDWKEGHRETCLRLGKQRK